MAYNSMRLHLNHMIKGLSCRQEARLQIISLLLSMVLTYTCAIFRTTKNHKTLHQFCVSLYILISMYLSIFRVPSCCNCNLASRKRERHSGHQPSTATMPMTLSNPPLTILRRLQGES